MNILEYHYRDVEEPGWDFAKIEFGKINLLVGDTATGKTRLLNTIFNLGRFAVTKEFWHGSWDIVFKHSGVTYTWSLQTEKKKDGDKPGIIVRDYIWRHENQSLIPIVERDSKTFIFAGQQMPKLSPKETSISLLKEEEIIQPLYQAFSIILRRRFFDDALSKVSELQVLSKKLIERIEEKKDLRKLFEAGMNLSANLFILRRYFKDIYEQIIDQYKRFFPFIQGTRITDLTELEPGIAVSGYTPVFSVQERGSDRWIPITELSSGMQKVLLISFLTRGPYERNFERSGIEMFVDDIDQHVFETA